MSNIDERVVEMKFDNAAFGRGVQDTIQHLEALNKSLKMEGATKGLNDISAVASKGISLEAIANGVEGIKSKFSAMSVVAITALSTIANKAVNTGLQVAKSLSVAPIMQGYHNYETQIGAIQTILANTSTQGVKLKDVNNVLSELNTYANQTVYSFAEMARNIGTFTAAGVDLKTSAESIKGIANLAAVSGSTSDQASTAMYQLSQALAAGTVKLQDWNSVVNAGMGGRVFQEALFNTAKQMKTIKNVPLGETFDQWTKKGNSFRGSMQQGWITSKVLSQTLAQLSGDLTDSQLKQMGYNDAQIKGIQAQAKMASDAATKLKTFTALREALKDETSSGWAATFKILIGNIDEAQNVFTGLDNVIGGWVQRSAAHRNAVLADWKALGGRTVIIQAITNTFHALIDIIKPIRDGFREIFPAATGKTLYLLSVAIRDFTSHLVIGATTANELKRTFAGVFAIFGIAWEVVKAVGHGLSELFSTVNIGSGGFLRLTARIGDWLVKLHAAIRDGDQLEQFFLGIDHVIEDFIDKLVQAGLWLEHVFGGASQLGGAAADNLQKRFAPLGALGQVIVSIWSHVGGYLKSAWTAFLPITHMFSSFFANIGAMIQGGFTNVNYNSILDTINTGLLAGITVLIRKFLKGGLKVDVGGGFLDTVKETFEGLTGTLKAMQTQLKAGTLLKIAEAVGILALSAVALSMVNSARLTVALTAIGVMMGELMSSMAVFSKVVGSAGYVKLPLLTLALMGLAISIDLLAIAVAKLARLDWEGLAKGLGGILILLAAVSVSTRIMSGNAEGMVRAGAGLILIAAAINLLVKAVTNLSGLSWNDMAKGITGVAAILAALTLFTRFSDVNKGGLAQGAGLLLLAEAIKILAGAVIEFSVMNWEELGKGLTGVAGGLIAMGAALKMIPPSSVFSAAGVLIVASSLGMIADAVKRMGEMQWSAIGRGLTVLAGALLAISGALALLPPSSLLSAAAIFVVASSLGKIADAIQATGGMSWEAIGKGLITLAGALVIIAGALYLMTGALPGAAAVLVVSGALAILTPVLVTLGGLSWEAIGKGLLTLAGAFAVLGIAGLLLTPLVPTLLALGVSVTLLGIGMVAAGAGVLLFSAGLTALAVSGAVGAAAAVGIITTLAGAIPIVMAQVGAGLVAFANVIAHAAPAFIGAISAVIISLATAIDRTAPKVIDTLLRLLSNLLTALANYIPRLIDAGARIIIGILNGMARHMPDIVAAATNLIITFIHALSAKMPTLLNAGADLIINFIHQLANTIRQRSGDLGAAGGDLATAIIEGMAKGLAGGTGRIADAAKGVASSALNSAKNFLGIKSPSKEFEKIGIYVNQGFYKGLTGSSRAQVDQAFNYLKDTIHSAMDKANKDVASAEAKLQRLTTARHRDNGAIAQALAQLAQARKEQALSTAAYTDLTTRLATNRIQLERLADQHAVIVTRIKAANDALAAAKKTRDDYYTSVKDQYSQGPDMAQETSLAGYEADLKKQIDDETKYAAALKKLRDLGLNDAAYKELVSKGPAELPFVNDILAAGKDGVDSINTLEGQLTNAAQGLASTAAAGLYQAAVDSAQGLVVGLQKQQAAIEKQMDIIATAMVHSIKKQLGIRSPSRVFAEVGTYSVQGLAKGLDDASVIAEQSAANVGTSALLSLRKTISGLGDIISSDMDMTPVITPVLDLSGVKKDAEQLATMLTATPLAVTPAYSQAKDASSGYDANRAAGTEAAVVTEHTEVSLTQNNYSPKALSSVEIYRNTNNQLSVLKGALDNKV